MERQPWQRLKSESGKAYAAFCAYYQLPARERSIDEAWRRARNQQGTSNHADGTWTGWSTKHDWPARALAYDEHLAEQDRLLWEERRRQMRERDWAQAADLRRIIDEALPHAERFIRTQRTVIPGRAAVSPQNGQPGQPGAPDREVITMSFDITGLSRVLVEASKLQRLATNEPTDHLQLSGAALDALIARGLEALADTGEAGAAEADTAETDRTAGHGETG